MVLEALSPHPRIGKLEERIGWFAEYGVREIWLLHQLKEQLEILGALHGRVVSRKPFDYRTPIESDVLPEFTMTAEEILCE
jgi:Uma2 family endonuclease